PGNEGPVAVLAAQQRPYRRLRRAAHRVEEGHLQPRAERVLPHALRGALSDDALDGGVTDGAVRVILHRLPEALDAALQGHPADLEEGPVRQLPHHVPRRHLAEWDVDRDALDVLDGKVHN